MANPFDAETGDFTVLINAEGQHSLWPAFREAPAGWSAAGKSGTRQECVDWIEAHWTDMRPKSLLDAESCAKP
jgi:uncharacterized protein YbdZ (MbtH family)